MRAEPWAEVDRLFGKALDLPASERERWLHEATPSQDLRDEVLSLLRAHDRTSGLLDRSPIGTEPGAADEGFLRTGERLGRYEIVEPLASGGMAHVYRAYDTVLRREVALKRVAPHLSESARSLALFEREMRAVAALAHPNIVTIFDVGEEGGRAFAVLELLRGRSLRARLNAGPLGVREALRVGRDVARGLAAAHAAGLVHRDLKPSNVFLTEEGIVKILDFGIARTLEGSRGDEAAQSAAADARRSLDATSVTGLVGTPGYLSPEQARAGPADARSDVFSFGCLLYECLSGRRAFPANDLAEALRSVQTTSPIPLSQLAPTIPRAVAVLVDRCLRQSPDERFPSGTELRDALEPLAAALEAPSPRRRRMTAALGTAALLLAVAVGVWGVKLWRTRDIAPETPGGLVFRKNATDGAEYSRIPPGTFGMGCDPNLSTRPLLPCDTRSQPFTKVTIARPYWVMRTEVTVGQFAAYAKSTGSPMPTWERLDLVPPRLQHLKDSLFSRPDNPVVLVDWHEASAYCGWAGGRLPSESEWERAARANHEWDFVWGLRNLGPGSPPLANVRDESRFRAYGPHIRDDGTEAPDDYYKGYDDGFPDLAPVGSFPPNDFGLFDMGGNVWEWTLDTGPAPFKVPPYDGHPTDGSPRLDWDGTSHVVRGSGWDFGPPVQAVWVRDVGSSYGHGAMLGFRCVRDTPP